MDERPPMPPERFRECLLLTRRTLRGYQREIKAGGLATVAAWANGTRPVPADVGHHLERDAELMARAAAENPPPRPDQWRQGPWGLHRARPEK